MRRHRVYCRSIRALRVPINYGTAYRYLCVEVFRHPLYCRSRRRHRASACRHERPWPFGDRFCDDDAFVLRLMLIWCFWRRLCMHCRRRDCGVSSRNLLCFWMHCCPRLLSVCCYRMCDWRNFELVVLSLPGRQLVSITTASAFARLRNHLHHHQQQPTPSPPPPSPLATAATAGDPCRRRGLQRHSVLPGWAQRWDALSVLPPVLRLQLPAPLHPHRRRRGLACQLHLPA